MQKIKYFEIWRLNLDLVTRFVSSLRWHEKKRRYYKKNEKETHDKSKISNLDQAKLFKYSLTKRSIKWIEAWSPIDSIIIIWVVTILRSLKVFQLWPFFTKLFNETFLLFWEEEDVEQIILWFCLELEIKLTGIIQAW